MSKRIIVLLAVALLLLPSGGLGLWAAPACDPGNCGCGCGEPEPSELPALSPGCCCEARPAPDGPFESPTPVRLGSAGPELPELTPFPLETALAPPALSAEPRLVRAAEPRPPPRPLFLLHAAFLC